MVVSGPCVHLYSTTPGVPQGFYLFLAISTLLPVVLSLFIALSRPQRHMNACAWQTPIVYLQPITKLMSASIYFWIPPHLLHCFFQSIYSSIQTLDAPKYKCTVDSLCIFSPLQSLCQLLSIFSYLHPATSSLQFIYGCIRAFKTHSAFALQTPTVYLQSITNLMPACIYFLAISTLTTLFPSTYLQQYPGLKCN